MKLLLLSLWYTPEPVFKPHDFARELARRGHEVTVITGFPNYPVGKIYAGYHRHLKQSEMIDGVHVLRIPHLIDHSASVFHRLLSYTSFTLTAIFAGITMACKPDAIWTYQIGLPGVVLALVKKAPLVHEVQDLWPEWGQTIPGGMKRGMYQLLSMQERLIYRSAKAIVTISNGFREALITKGAPDNKIIILPNWASEENFSPAVPDPALAKREGLGQHFCIMYVGNIGTAQALGIVVEAACLLKEIPDIEFVVIGDGVERESLERRVTAQGLTNIRFLGSRLQAQAAAYLAWADVALIHLKPDPVYEITIPSKTYAYLAVGKPILAAAEGDTAHLIETTGAGFTCSPGDPQALAKTVLRFYALSESERQAMGEAGRRAFLAGYTRQVLVDRYESLFSCVSQSLFDFEK